MDLISSTQQPKRREYGNVNYTLIIDGASSPRHSHGAAVPRVVKQVYVNKLGRDPATGAYGYFLRPVEPDLRPAAQPMSTYSTYAPTQDQQQAQLQDLGSAIQVTIWIRHVNPTITHHAGVSIRAGSLLTIGHLLRPCAASAHPDGYVQPFRHVM